MTVLLFSGDPTQLSHLTIIIFLLLLLLLLL